MGHTGTSIMRWYFGSSQPLACAGGASTGSLPLGGYLVTEQCLTSGCARPGQVPCRPPPSARSAQCPGTPPTQAPWPCKVLPRFSSARMRMPSSTHPTSTTWMDTTIINHYCTYGAMSHQLLATHTASYYQEYYKLVLYACLLISLSIPTLHRHATHGTRHKVHQDGAVIPDICKPSRRGWLSTSAYCNDPMTWLVK